MVKRLLTLLAMLFAACPVWAQSGSYFQGVVQTQTGLKGGAQITVCAAAIIATSPTGATESSNTVTITTTAAHGFVAGQVVQVTGVLNNLYNGSITILSVPTTTSFTYTNANTGLAASGGGVVLPTNVPCSPAASVFSDIGLTAALAQPLISSGLGNFGFFATPGLYVYSLTGAGIVPSSGGPFTINLPPGTNLTNAWTAPQTFTQQIVSTVPTGTAPFSIASTTVVPNLNAQLLSGQTAPASSIVGISDTQTLTNKSLTAPVVTNPSTTGADSGAETLTNKTFDISLNTLKTATNTAGHYPRNNGTQYVDNTIQSADVPAINLAASGNGGVAGTLPGANMSAVNLAASGNGGVSGVLPVGNEGTGTPSAGKYVDGGTGAWTAIPTGNESTLGWGAASFTLGVIDTCPNSDFNPPCPETVFARAHTLVRFTYILTTSPAGCTTSPQIGVRDNTSNTVLTSLTIANGAALGFVDSGALSIATTAGHRIGVGLTAIDGGCSTLPVVGALTAVSQ